MVQTIAGIAPDETQCPMDKTAKVLTRLAAWGNMTTKIRLPHP